MKNYFTIAVIVALIFVSQTAYSQSRIPHICTGGVRNSAATCFPQPEYPKEAKEKNISGVVNVRVSIDEEGNVSSAKACSGHPLLRPEAEKAAMKTKFKPTMLSGQPVGVFGVLVYNFVQDKSDKPSQILQEPLSDFEPTVIHFGIINDKAISLPQPDYTKNFLQDTEKNSVKVEVKINLQEGAVVSAMAVSGNSSLRKYAVETAMSAKFDPVKIEGRTLFAKGIINYDYPPQTIEKLKDEKNISKFPIIVTDKMVNKKAKYLLKPVFSADCHCSGIIKIRIVVDINGDVINTSTESGHPLLKSAALESAKNTKFHPSFINGTPIYVVGYLIYKFNSDGTIETDIESDDKDVLVKSIQPIGEIDKTKKPIIINHLPLGSKPLFSPQPEYPVAARFVNASGKVTVQILIDENGNIEKVKAVSGHPLLRSAAEKAAKQIKFKPITLSGNPVKVRSLVTFTFTP